VSLSPEKLGDKGQRYAISYILPDGTEFGIGYANDPEAFTEAAESWPKLKGATRKVVDRQPTPKCIICAGTGTAQTNYDPTGVCTTYGQCTHCGGTGTILPEPVEDPVTIRAKEIYQMAWERVAGMLAMYQVRKFPKTRVQGLPAYNNEREYEFFKDMTGDTAILALTFTEYQTFLVAIEKILQDNGIKSQRVAISQKEFKTYVAEAESGQ
jgi:hypothetical protein